MFRGCSHDQIRILPERHVDALPVHLRCRGDEHELLLLVGVLQHDFGAVDVGLDGAYGLFHDQLDAHCGGQMEHDIASVDEFRQQRFVGHRVDDVLNPRVPLR